MSIQQAQHPRYEILDLIGRGGMGDVHRARDRQLGRVVAAKALRRGARSAPDLASRLEREARLAASLDHPFICKVHELVTLDSGDTVLVMEYVEGRTLKAIIDDGPIELERALKLASEIAEALQFAHARGVLHRDVKPANVVVMADHHVKVMDFGIAKIAEQADGLEGPDSLPEGMVFNPTLTQTGHVFGTPAYMAPEQAEGQVLDARADVYSFGILFYECLTGLYPPASPTPRWPARSRIPADVRAVVDRCLEPTAVERFASLVETKAAIDAALARRRVVEVRTKTRRVLVVAGAIAAAAAALVFAWLQISARPTFTLGPHHWGTENSGINFVPGWASDFDRGSSGNDTPRYTFTVTNDFQRLFLFQPGIQPDGKLAYLPATNAIGTAIVTVTLTDHQKWPTWFATSAPKTFTISVTPPRHPAVAGDDHFSTRESTPLVVAAETPPTGQVHSWRGDGDWRDSIRAGVDGTPHGGAGFTVGRSGQAFSFDGIDDAVTFGRRVGDFGTNDFSIAFLLRATSNRPESVLGKRAVCGGDHMSFFDARLMSRGDLLLEVQGIGIGGLIEVVTSRGFGDGAYHAIVVTRLGPMVSAYVDGVFSGAGFGPAVSTLSNAADFTLGVTACAGVDGTRPFSGALDEVAIFDRALSADEIRRLHHHGVLRNDSNDLGSLLTAVLTTSPSHGALTFNPDGTFRYVPAPGFHGEDHFSYQARNIVNELSASATVAITVTPAR